MSGIPNQFPKILKSIARLTAPAQMPRLDAVGELHMKIAFLYKNYELAKAALKAVRGKLPEHEILPWASEESAPTP